MGAEAAEGLHQGTMGVRSASAWLNNSSSDEDGDADEGESSAEQSKGGTDRSISADARTTPFG